MASTSATTPPPKGARSTDVAGGCMGEGIRTWETIQLVKSCVRKMVVVVVVEVVAVVAVVVVEVVFVAVGVRMIVEGCCSSIMQQYINES
eukprot:8317867-Pyramimonas_sp.AAC.1